MEKLPFFKQNLRNATGKTAGWKSIKEFPMGQYRVIVVDDEEEIREGIIRKIDWNALGYEVVGSAENGCLLYTSRCV